MTEADRLPWPPTRERQLVEQLLDERGLRRRALFLTQREGLDLPGGLEAISGFALADDGMVYGFWLSWDPVRRRYLLAPFYPVEEPEAAFAQDAEYHQARRALGLA
ncbi:MAG: hypothetical protein M3O34_00345 [Chloroflexota bacterium]|nr:hypothetical protein [Chloroflexota bacterium]